MKISEFLTEIKEKSNYVNNSLVLKSSDNYGCVYKYLVKLVDGSAIRKEIFIELNPEESELDLENKEIINNIEIFPAR
jgi:hypothetical protein